MIYPRISIVTPTFNRADYLEETIISVLNQGYPNLEYIIIDGGSNDNTIEIINKYKKRLVYWISEPDEGMYHAIQNGFSKSTGEIMAWINSDDKYFPGALFVVSQIFYDLPEVEWIMGMPALFEKKGLCVKVNQEKRWSKSRFWINDYKWIQQENVFWRRTLWEKAGAHLDTSRKYAADFELWCRFFKYSQLFSVSTTLGGFRLHGNQTSLQKKDQYENEVKQINTKYAPSSGEKSKFFLLNKLWKFSTLLGCRNFKISKYFKIILNKMIDNLHKYPPVIYYDFENNQWKK